MNVAGTSSSEANSLGGTTREKQNVLYKKVVSIHAAYLTLSNATFRPHLSPYEPELLVTPSFF
jgi:hypothetical protein